MTTLRERYGKEPLDGIPGWLIDMRALIDLVDELVRTRRPYPCSGWDDAVNHARQVLG